MSLEQRHLGLQNGVYLSLENYSPGFQGYHLLYLNGPRLYNQKPLESLGFRECLRLFPSEIR